MCCYVLKDEKLIHIEEKTQQFKYEFLSSYIPMWNKIICGRGRRPRAIIDTHAGTGKVKLEYKELLGSCGLFLKKTALKQELLEFYFIEKDFKNYHALKKNINEICRNGFHFSPKYKIDTEGIQKDGLPYEKKVKLYSSQIKYPKLEQIHFFRGDCVNIIGHVLKEINGIPAFFFIDPCGKFSWKLIDLIIKNRILDENGNIKLEPNGRKIQGTELFINFSWEAVLRNMTKKNGRAQFFNDMFGINYIEVQKEVAKVKKEKKKSRKRYHTYNLYMDVYKKKLEEFFDYVIEMSIIGIKSEKNPVYVMIFCSNNEIANNLYQNKEAELNKLKSQYQHLKNLSPHKKEFSYSKYKSFMEGQRFIDEFFDIN
ncbi:MAG: three-Cys-motif partner protein TcmP [Promethearchaeota archaeon]